MHETKSEIKEMTASALNSLNKISCVSCMAHGAYHWLIHYDKVNCRLWRLTCTTAHTAHLHNDTCQSANAASSEGTFPSSIPKNHQPANHSVCGVCSIARVTLNVIGNILCIFYLSITCPHNFPIPISTQTYKT